MMKGMYICVRVRLSARNHARRIVVNRPNVIKNTYMMLVHEMSG